MIRTLLPLALAAGLVAAAPAMAQTITTQSAPASWKPLPERASHVGEEIADGVSTGALSDAQAHGLRDQFKGLLNLEDQYAKSGLTPAQLQDLQARYDTLEARIQVETHPASIESRRERTD